MGGSLILAINLALGAAIMICFLAFGFYDRSQRAAFWFVAACVAAIFAGAIEYSMPGAADTGLPRFLIFSVFAASVASLSAGLALLYSGRVPWRALLAGIALAIAAYLTIADMPRASLTRSVVYQLAYAGLQLIGLYHVLKGMERRAVDRLVLLAVTLNVAQYLLRPPLQFLLGGNGERGQDYLGTDYAMASQTLMAITTIMLAIAVGIRILSGILANIQARSQTDQLSGVLNREGFLRRVEGLLTGAVRGRGPMALVLCDLDHFKAINDTYGHQTGDAVIAGFGRLLMASKRAGDLAGRIGGEEFCVLLVNCDTNGARLFAEQVRSAFALSTHCSTPDGLDGIGGRTASFGVAEVDAGERFEAAFSRADRALYEAKRAGRNCVRVARSPGWETAVRQHGIASIAS